MPKIEGDDLCALANLFSNPHTYLAVNGSTNDTTESILRYVNDHPVVQLSDEPAWIVVVPRKDDRFYVDRLASGLIQATLHIDYDSARDAAGEEAYVRYERRNR